MGKQGLKDGYSRTKCQQLPEMKWANNEVRVVGGGGRSTRVCHEAREMALLCSI